MEISSLLCRSPSPDHLEANEQRNSKLLAINFDDFKNLALQDFGNIKNHLLQLMNKFDVKNQNNEDEKINFNFCIEQIQGRENIISMIIELEWEEEEENQLQIQVLDDEERCILGYIELGKKKSRLDHLDATENISGTALMKIWDTMCLLFHAKKIYIHDVAQTICKHCKKEEQTKTFLMLWRIFSDITAQNQQKDPQLIGSWYENFGYRLHNKMESNEEYHKAVEFLSKITLGKLRKIYKENHQVLSLLNESYNFLREEQDVGLFSSVPFSAVIQKMDEYIKNDHIKEDTHKLFHRLKGTFITRSSANNYNLFFEEKKFSMNYKITPEFFEHCLYFISTNTVVKKLYN